MTFHDESRWFLLLLPAVIPLIWWRWARQGRHASVRFSSLEWLARRGTTLRARLRILVPVLRTLTVSLLIVCLARPQKGNEETRILSEGIAIQTLVDVSGSMESLDFELEGKPANRLQAIKKVFREFVSGNGDDLPGRPNDLIGLITFAGYADTKSPLTLDHAAVLDLLNNTDTVMNIEVQKRLWELQRQYERAQQTGAQARARDLESQIGMLRDEDGTAIGDAIGLAVKNLTELERRRRVGTDQKIKSKIIVLLTDGANNRGDMSPSEAAQIAAAFGFKIYAIGVGTGRRVYVPQWDPFSGSARLIPQDFPMDEKTLQTVSEVTGGTYFRAVDADALHRVYTEIDQLEKTRTEEKRYMQFREWATEWMKLGAVPIPPLLILGLGLFALEVLLANTVFRKIP